MKLRLLHVITDLHAGGAQTQLALLTQGLDSTQFDIHVCSLAARRHGMEAQDGEAVPAEIHEIGMSVQVQLSSWLRLYGLIRRLRPDIVHFWQPDVALIGTPLARMAGATTVVVTDRSRQAPAKLTDVPLRQLAAKICRTIVVNHDIVCDQWLSFGVAPDKMRVIRDGIAAPSPIRPIASPRQEPVRLVAQLQLPDTTSLIGVSGHLLREKRISDALWGIDLLSCIRNDVHLIVVGDGPYRSSLERFAKQIRIADRVHFLGERWDARQLIAQCRVYWLTSERESMPLGLLEAMALGVPVVATRLPALTNVVIPGDTGFVIDVGNRGELARATQRILDNPTCAARLAEYGRNRVTTMFSAVRMVEQYHELYLQSAADPNGRCEPGLRNHDQAHDVAPTMHKMAPSPPSQSPHIK